MISSQRPTFLGQVRDVQGPTLSIQLDDATLSGLIFHNGCPYRVGQVGSFIRVPLGYLDLFGIISQVGAGAVPNNVADEGQYGFRWLKVELIGEAHRSGQFQRGISCFPTIGDSAFLVTDSGLRKIFGRPNEPNAIRVGHLINTDSIPALLDANLFVSRHSALVGSTGSGKSTTVASLLHTLSNTKRYPASRIIVLDLHGEYSRAFPKKAKVFSTHLQPCSQEDDLPLNLPYWALTFEELLPLTFGDLPEKDRAYVADQIVRMKRETLQLTPYPGVDAKTITVDTPVPFSIHKLWLDLYREIHATHSAQGKAQCAATQAFELDEQDHPVQTGDALRVIPPLYRPVKNVGGDSDKVYYSSSLLQIGRALELLASRLRDPRFDFLFKPQEWQPDLSGKTEADLDSFLSTWIGGNKPISILDISGIPPEILSRIIGVLLRIIYDSLFWAKNLPEGGRERPLLFVLEEAHLYLNNDSSSATRIVQRIVKEGRKYGVGAMIVSQRPSEINPTVLSQCGTSVIG